MKMSVSDAVALWKDIVAAAGTDDPNKLVWCGEKVSAAQYEKVDSLWYDWFCPSHQLTKRGLVLLKRLSKVAGSEKFDPDKCYVFFKNDSSLADDFRICDRDTGNVLYTVGTDLWGVDNNFADPLAHGLPKIKKFFGV